MKKIISVLLVLSLLLTLAPVAGAIPIVTVVDSGDCGTNLTWTLMSDGALTISGTGAMWNWYSSSSVWYSYRSSIKSVTIESGVTTIGDYAFAWCDSLTSVTIGNSVTTIGDCAFYDCDSLTSVTIPDSVTTIGEWAFAWCDSLTSVTIPDSVTTIGNSAFNECTKLTYNLYDNGKYLGNESNPYLYLADTTSRSITNCTIHPSTRFIGGYAFEGCYNLTSITIPDSVTTIGNSAFYYCDNLTSVTIGNGVTTIGAGAFYECSGLTSVTIPDSVTTIGAGAFEDCTSLTDVYYNGTKTQWGKISIGDNNVTLRSATLHTLPEPELTDYSLNLDSAIRLNFYVSEVAGFTSYIDMDGTRYDKVDDFYPTREFHAKEMADTVSVKLVNEYGKETTEGDPMNVSIRNYAKTVLSMVDWNTPNGDYGAKSGRLMVAMLNYGTEAQKYFGYNTTNPANANISQYQKYLTDTPTCADHRTGNDNPLYYGTACVLGANMNMKFYLKLKTAEGREGWNYRISYTNYLGKEVEKDLTFAQLTDSNNGFYSYTLTELVAADIDTPVTLKVLDGDTEKLCVTDSISSYLARIMVSNPDCADVANAMLLFGAKAYDYFEGSVTPPALDEDELPLN